LSGEALQKTARKSSSSEDFSFKPDDVLLTKSREMSHSRPKWDSRSHVIAFYFGRLGKKHGREKQEYDSPVLKPATKKGAWGGVAESCHGRVLGSTPGGKNRRAFRRPS